MLSLKLNILIISTLLFSTSLSQDYQNVDSRSMILDNYMAQNDVSVEFINKKPLKNVFLKDDAIEFFSRSKRKTFGSRLKAEQLRNKQAF
ncbi:Hypothetical protein SRAE_X000224400 [Strongyloides ratti]|uniref:Uncharacterized protein n=1 Tax=Strongyloides ratti TaxID=34506 RepID=A0A090KSM0_STRRB|nr:Hypothetical protein SRAE_X000224400 [Strongyloides ratti]CEF60505.1 Hypothetical protein SRAE_X000224400 [Strongyloides ratti]